jgi:hypothetical protein
MEIDNLNPIFLSHFFGNATGRISNYGNTLHFTPPGFIVFHIISYKNPSPLMGEGRVKSPSL